MSRESSQSSKSEVHFQSSADRVSIQALLNRGVAGPLPRSTAHVDETEGDGTKSEGSLQLQGVSKPPHQQGPHTMHFTPMPKRRRWTPAEDRRLADLVQQYGPRRWQKIAEYFPGRTADHARLRYKQYLRFSYEDRIREWTPQEDALILEEGRVHRRWSMVADRIQRSSNSVRNRYHLLESCKPPEPPRSPEHDQRGGGTGGIGGV